MLRAALLTALLSLAFPSSAAPPEDAVGVEIAAEGVEAALAAGAVAVDARSEYSHKSSRLPGAASVGLPSKALRDPATSRALPKKKLEALWAQAGVPLSREILVYGDETPLGVEEAYYAAFALRLAGAAKVQVVSRGFSAIEMEGIETEEGEAKPAAAAEPSRPSTVRQVPIAEALALEKKGAPIVYADFRSPSDFAKGHIPGARNIPFEDLFAEDGSLKGKAGLEKAFAGLPKGHRVLAYCWTGLKSSGALPVMEALGFEAAAIDEAWNGWASMGLPKAVGP